MKSCQHLCKETYNIVYNKCSHHNYIHSQALTLNLHILFVKEIQASPKAIFFYNIYQQRFSVGTRKLRRPLLQSRYDPEPQPKLYLARCTSPFQVKEKKRESLCTEDGHIRLNKCFWSRLQQWKQSRGAVEQLTLFKVTLLGWEEGGAGESYTSKGIFHIFHSPRIKVWFAINIF